jgi:FemAB-related protein (PEP-CTERM system-associated)
VFSHECLFLAARSTSDGHVAGVLPLVRVKSRLFGHFLVSMPFVNYGGPLGGAEAVRLLVDHAIHIARVSGVKLLELRSRRSMELDLPVSHRKITSMCALPAEGPAALWSGLSSNLRNKIRRPQKEGVTVRAGPGELEVFYTVFAQCMRDLGTPVQSPQFFRSLMESFPDDLWVACAYYGGRPVAGVCGLTWGDEFESTWYVSLKEFNRARPLMLLHWTLMERAAELGLRWYNFGRCTPGSGIHEFKRRWGTQDAELWWYQYSERGAVNTPAPSDRTYAWGPRLWRHLPLSVANRLGPRIVQSIP